ncbi:MAG: carbonic anhydrase [Planctomycetota bacterium]|jgi:hypothetical protein
MSTASPRPDRFGFSLAKATDTYSMGCAGNPAPDDVQKDQLQQAVPFLKKQYPECDVIGLWIGQTDDDNWDVQQLL